MMDGLLRIRTACVDRALSSHPAASLIIERVEKRIAEVLVLARTIERGSRRERSNAVVRLIEIAGSETPDLSDAVTAAAKRAIREVAAEQGWTTEHAGCLEEQTAYALRVLERTLDELAPA